MRAVWCGWHSSVCQKSLWRKHTGCPRAAVLRTVAELVLILCDPTDGSPSGSSVHGIFQAGILEWVATSYSGESSWPRDQFVSPALAGGFFTIAPPGKPNAVYYVWWKWIALWSLIRRSRTSSPSKLCLVIVCDSYQHVLPDTRALTISSYVETHTHYNWKMHIILTLIITFIIKSYLTTCCSCCLVAKSCLTLWRPNGP